MEDTICLYIGKDKKASCYDTNGYYGCMESRGCLVGIVICVGYNTTCYSPV